MKRLAIFLIAFLFIGSLLSSASAGEPVRGITMDPESLLESISGAVAPAGAVQHSRLPFELKGAPVGLDDWVPIDTISAWVRVPQGQRYVLSMNPTSGSIEEIYPPNELNDYVMGAVNRAPRWLRHDLIQNLNQIHGDGAEFFREMLAQLILDTDEPMVDEVAFTVAHISSDLLGTGVLYFDLFLENAESIYEIDDQLDYVRLVDYGSVEDGDYWTTVEYNIKNAEGDTVQVELDRYYYYWYIVHPRLSDERPLYINPATGRSAAPPRGVFWRDFLLHHPDEGYPSLLEAVQDCGVLWSNLHNDGSLDNGAIGGITTWIRTVLEFDSRQERPIQPVRIYRLHMGRCGEHEDLTAAAGRSALIPTVGIAAITNDHVWNEFYAGRWIQWEPVNNYVDDSLAYERWQNGNWRVSALFRWRGDGFIETVTSRYQSHTASLVMHVLDADDRPVDGARLVVRSEYLHGGLTLATCAFTNSDGEARIEIGETRNIYLDVSSPVGNHAQERAVENAVEDRVYEWSCNLNGEIEPLDIEPAEPPGNPVNHYHLRVAYEPTIETVMSRIFQYSTFFAGIYPARLDFFICDADNYQRYLDGERFAAYHSAEITEAGEVEFALPTDGEWFAVFSNDQRVSCLEDILLTVYWSRDAEWSVPGDAAEPGIADRYRLAQNYPNPFNSATVVPFFLPTPGNATLAVCDLQGREVFRKRLENLAAGRHTVRINADGLDSGVYIYALRSGGFTDAGKMIVLK